MWCKYICPVGTTYNFLGWTSATKVEWDMSKCDHCGACLDACFEPHVIEFIKPKYDKDRKEKGVEKQIVINGDCTLCGRCLMYAIQDALLTYYILGFGRDFRSKWFQLICLEGLD